jgi:hypothetical protein
MTFKNGVLSGSPTEPDKAYTVWFKRNGRRATVTMRTMPYPKLVLEVDPGLENYTDPNVEIPAVNLGDFKLTGAGSYKAGTLVKLGATAPEGWIFAGWSGVYEPSPFLDEKNEDTRLPSYVL